MAVTAPDEEDVKGLWFSQVCEMRELCRTVTLEAWPDTPAGDHSEVTDICTTWTLRADAIVLAHCEWETEL